MNVEPIIHRTSKSHDFYTWFSTGEPGQVAVAGPVGDVVKPYLPRISRSLNMLPKGEGCGIEAGVERQ